MATQPTYYTIANAPFFPGVVALLNSLRLTGNEGELVVLDAGLTDEQRRALAPHARVVPLPREVVDTPYLAKPFPYRLENGGTIALIDADIIVTRNLRDVIAPAGAGKICLYPDHTEARERWFGEWEDVFALERPLRRRPYMNTGFVALSVDRWRGLLRRWWEACERIPASRLFTRDPDQPFWAADQDALNAVLMSEVPPEAVESLPEREMALWDALPEVEVRDGRTLECSRGNVRCAMLHFSYRPKPWQRRAWLRVQDDAFVRLLPRVLFEPDVPLRLDPAGFPLWVHPGRAGRAIVHVLDGGHRLGKATIGVLPAPIRRRATALRNELFYRLPG